MSYVGRAYTDPYSNSVVLPEFALSEHAGALIKGHVPLEYLPKLLHEFTHHWCFQSPVGLALTLLSARARRRAMLKETAGIEFNWIDIVDDLIRCDWADGLLRPLSEGLALFAEHDVIPGDAMTISKPVALAVPLCVRGHSDERLDGAKLLERIPIALRQSRLNRNHIRRKANLLLQPMTAADGGYLIGYLTMKQLWGACIERSTKFFDSDFFLHFTRAFFYDDWDLVALLLTDEASDVGMIGLVSEYLQRRLARLRTDERIDALARRFEAEGVAGKADTFEHKRPYAELTLHPYPVDGAVPDTHPGKTRLRALIDEMFDVTGAEQSALAHLDGQLLSFRPFVTLGHQTFDARVTDGHELTLSHNGQTYMRLLNVEGMSPGWTGEATHDLLLHWNPGLYSFVLADGKLINCQSIYGADLPAWFADSLASRASRDVYSSATDKVLREAARTDGSSRLLLNHLDKNLAFLPEAIFFPFPDATDQKDLRAHGLLTALGGNADEVQDAAALALAAANEVDAASLDRKWTGGTPSSTAQAINRRMAVYTGTSAFYEGAGGARLSLI